jgi:cold shock CspA family protein
VARFIAAITGSRKTSIGDVPTLIACVRNALAGLGTIGQPEALAEPPAPVRRRKARKAAVAVAPEEATATPRRRRGRPRSVEAPAEDRARRPKPAATAPVAPRLMRRAEVAPAEPTFLEVRSPLQTILRGVVRWFDQRTRQGLLRLPGFSDDVAIEAAMLEKSGISRLYKGQEIDATVAGENGSAQLVALALPGRVAEPGGGLFKTGSARRNAKPVVVEMKRDSMRRAAARVEAEHVLGKNGRGNSD